MLYILGFNTILFMFKIKCHYSLKQIDQFVIVFLCALFVALCRNSHANSWSSDGCRVTFASSGVTSCLCNHTTNFAVLMNYLESKVSHGMFYDAVHILN